MINAWHGILNVSYTVENEQFASVIKSNADIPLWIAYFIDEQIVFGN